MLRLTQLLLLFPTSSPALRSDYSLQPPASPLPAGCDPNDYTSASNFMYYYHYKFHNGEYKTLPGGIPNIVHRILLKDHSFPERDHKWISTVWKNTHIQPNDFVSVIWSGADAKTLVAKEYPHLQGVYDSFPKDIQRSDFIRYLILDRYGGIYMDHDIELKSDLNVLIADAYKNENESSNSNYDFLGDKEDEYGTGFPKNIFDFRIFRSPYYPIRQKAVLKSDKHEYNFRIANYFMMAAPGSVGGQNIIKEVRRRASYQMDPDSDYDVFFNFFSFF